MAKGIPVVISPNGMPITPVQSGAPLLTVSGSGFGVPVTIAENAAPFVVDGLKPFDPSQLNPDAWFDPSDASTVFVDRAGTVLATAGSPVGQIRDKSGKGNHAVAPTDAARPTLARMPATGRRNLLTYTEDLSAGVWQNVNVIKTTNKLVATTLSSQHRIDRNITIPVGAVYSAIVKHAGYQYVGIRFDSAYTWFDLEAGIIMENTNGSAGIEAIGDGSFKIWTTNIDTEKTVLRFNISDIVYVNNPFAGDGVSGVELCNQQLEAGPTFTAYQKVTNAFDVTEAGVPDVWYLRGDGVDDALNATMPAGQYTRAFCSANGTVTFEEDISISGQENILRVNQIVGIIYVRRNLTIIEKQLLTQYWKAKSYE